MNKNGINNTFPAISMEKENKIDNNTLAYNNVLNLTFLLIINTNILTLTTPIILNKRNEPVCALPV